MSTGVNEQNLYSLYRKLSTTDGAGLYEYDDFSVVFCDGSSWPNIVFGIREVNTESIRKITDTLNYKRIQPLVFCPEKDVDASCFKTAGYAPIDLWIAMNFKIDYPLEYVIDESVTIHLLNDEIPSDEWLNVVSGALFGNKPLKASLFAKASHNGIELIEMKKDDKTVGTCLINYFESTGGIYLFVVDKNYRGLGLGKMMLAYSINRITTMKKKTCVLQATKAGFPLYKSMGFQPDGKHLLYWKIK